MPDTYANAVVDALVPLTRLMVLIYCEYARVNIDAEEFLEGRE